jgi:glucose-1-phosphate cytidylyltransferase
MKVLIFAGGYGTRISEESQIRPKPMVEIGGKPIIWHIMKIYAAHGLNEFVVLCGYKGHMLKEYFFNYKTQYSDFTVDLASHDVSIHSNKCEQWKVTLVDTGLDTMTGGRLKRVKEYLNNETFCLTYGDGLSNVNITESIAFHKAHKKPATVTVVQPPGRFGLMQMEDNNDQVLAFKEKPVGDGGSWINGGYFVLEPSVLDGITDDTTVWEQEPLMNLAHNGQLMAYRHTGFWQPMDTLRDKNELEKMWTAGKAPWKQW